MRTERGFTLIELLIVIGIIAILAAAVIVAINPGQQFEQARNSARRSQLSSLASSIYSWSVEHQGRFPNCITDEFQNLGDLTDCEDSGQSLEDLMVPDYISSFPEDPADDNYQVRAVDGILELTSESEEFDEVIVQ